MNKVKRVEFTITRADVWPWIKTIAIAIRHGGCRVKLSLDTDRQVFIHELDVSEKGND